MAALGRSTNCNRNSNSSRSSSNSSRSSQSASTTATVNSADYDANDCSVSIILGLRGRQRQRNYDARSRSGGVRGSSQPDGDVSEARADGGGETLRQMENFAEPERGSVRNAAGYTAGQAPRLLREIPASANVELSNAVCQLLTGQSSYNMDNDANVSHSLSLELLSDSGSISFTDEVDAEEEAGNELPLLDYGVDSPGDREPGQTEHNLDDDAYSTHLGEPSTVSESRLPESSTLAEIFRCFICLGKVVDAQLCPCCSKLVCLPCIKRWLTDQKPECPHCRSPLLVSQLVSCRFISEISMEVEKMQDKLGDGAMEKFCTAHDNPLSYFCTSCSVAVCSDCAILDEEHKGHIFEKLSVTYGRHKKKIRTEAAGLRRRRKELTTLIASVDKNIEAVLKGKDECTSEVHMAFRRMQAKVEEQLKCKLLALLAQKGSLTQEIELLDTILTELEQQLNTIPKSDLIAQEPNMSRMLQDIHTRSMSDVSRIAVSADFVSEVVPAYEYGEFVLKNYKSWIEKTQATVFSTSSDQTVNKPTDFSRDVVYSEILQAMGIAWRLKVYPSGIGFSQGNYVSVFLEMVDGGSEPATYEYGIEMQHRTKLHQRVVRKFSSDFEAGDCWGYYQFYRIDLLEKEGYITPDDDTLTLQFYVRSLTFCQQNQDLQRAIAKLQLERDNAVDQVAVLRRAFAATIWQRRRKKATRMREGHGSLTQAVASVVSNLSSARPGYKNLAVFTQHQSMKKHESGRKSAKWMQDMWSLGGSRGRSTVNPESNASVQDEDVGDKSRKRDVISSWERLARVKLIRKGLLFEGAVEAQEGDLACEEEGEVSRLHGVKSTCEESGRNSDTCEVCLERQSLQSADGKCKTNRKLKNRPCSSRASTSSKLSAFLANDKIASDKTSKLKKFLQQTAPGDSKHHPDFNKDKLKPEDDQVEEQGKTGFLQLEREPQTPAECNSGGNVPS